MPQRNAYYVEMRKYDDPANPSSSPYDVELPVTSSDAVMMPGGTPATAAINAAIPKTSISTSTSSTSTSTVAASSAVKAAYDRASTGITNAATAQTTANAAMPKAGGRFTGLIQAQLVDVTGTYMRNAQVTNSAGTQVATNWLRFQR